MSLGCAPSTLPDDTGSPPEPVETTPLEPGVTSFFLDETIDGEVVAREVLVHAPSEVDPDRAYPVAVFLHGAQGRNDGWVGTLSEYVEAGDFIGIYPQGHESFWALEPEPSTADDIGFVSRIMETLETVDGLDLTRARVVGYSNGAGLAHRLGIETSHFTGLAALTTALTVDHLPTDETRPLSVLQIHGTADETCPYAGGDSPVGHTFLPAEESAAIWAAAGDCDAEPTITPGPDRDLAWACPEGRTVRHFGVTGAGHGIPATWGGETPLWDRVAAFAGGEG